MTWSNQFACALNFIGLNTSRVLNASWAFGLQGATKFYVNGRFLHQAFPRMVLILKEQDQNLGRSDSWTNSRLFQLSTGTNFVHHVLSRHCSNDVSSRKDTRPGVGSILRPDPWRVRWSIPADGAVRALDWGVWCRDRKGECKISLFRWPADSGFFSQDFPMCCRFLPQTKSNLVWLSCLTSTPCCFHSYVASDCHFVQSGKKATHIGLPRLFCVEIMYCVVKSNCRFWTWKGSSPLFLDSRVRFKSEKLPSQSQWRLWTWGLHQYSRKESDSNCKHCTS